MSKKAFCISLLLFLTCQVFWGQEKKFRIHTVAFYNFENLFDTINNPTVMDDEWTPKGNQNWTAEKYHQKLQNLARVLSEIGTPENLQPPTLIGGAEIENRMVLEDLIQQPALQKNQYGIIHFDSPDNRGIDVALLYQKKFFRPVSYSAVPLVIRKENKLRNAKVTPLETEIETENEPEFAERIFTRDQLVVSGFLDNELIHIIVNHWPSRSGGEQKTSAFREAAGILNRKIIDSLQRLDSKAKIITMGDLNDSPFNKSVKKALNAKGNPEEVEPNGLFNPFENKAKKGFGTIAYRDAWDIFDQILVTETLLHKEYSGYQFWKAGIFSPPYVIQTSGAYKGYPLRHSATEVGFSDHFAVYIYLIKAHF
ncbi:endonuclease/exonuclease/phosphatase family protein [Flavobacterium agrisoli]|uniref:Endonuclease/exonuclease/phosphatase family protein n=1 Tax=Flavobacterium agrisoli TaxID=2793066 RepID=A0A934UJD7_9FLAO|nr:endonuclease/exonuclease/phosphatase family protein [Flavobacterium agrisoli]MBK0369393.1 endonuclease/exonuclease/phosphatase family protein [Flavobacterium agrisoli]